MRAQSRLTKSQSQASVEESLFVPRHHSLKESSESRNGSEDGAAADGL